MRSAIVAIALLLVGCHESELEPQTPAAAMRAPGEGAAEATYALAPVPAVFDPAPVRERPASISLGYVGDAPLTETPPSGRHWPYVQEPFHYVEPYPTYYGYRSGFHRAYGRGRWMRVPRY